MTQAPEDIPEKHRFRAEGKRLDPYRIDSLGYLGMLFTRLRQAREVAFYIGHEYGHTDLGEAFGHYLKRYGFTGAGRPHENSMAVGSFCRKKNGCFCIAADKYLRGHGSLFPESESK